jgi:ribosomal protein S13
MKNEYFNAESIVKSVLLKAETKTFDVKIDLNGKTYLVGVTTKSSDELIENFDFSHLPNDLTDEQIEEIADKVMEAVSGFPTDGSTKHYDQEELKKFYQGLAFFDYTRKDKPVSPATKDLANSVRTWIIENVDNDDMEQYRWWLNIKHPSIEDIAKILNELADY